jgi:hypothetical protein
MDITSKDPAIAPPIDNITNPITSSTIETSQCLSQALIPRETRASSNVDFDSIAVREGDAGVDAELQPSLAISTNSQRERPKSS